MSAMTTKSRNYRNNFTNGEGLPWYLAERLCEVNGWAKNSLEFAQAECGYRRCLERAWRAGELKGRSYPALVTVPPDGSFEGTYFFLGDIEDWAKKAGEFRYIQVDCIRPALAGGRTECTKQQRVVTRHRQDRLTLAIQGALVALRKKHNQEPSADEVFSHLADWDETGAVVDSTLDKLIWEDTRGRCHDTCRKSLANRLSRLR